jgi:hypothetical protein
MGQNLPDPAAPLVDGKSFAPTNVWYQILDLLWSAFNTLQSQANDTDTGLGTKAAKAQLTEDLWVFKFPEAESVVLEVQATLAYTIIATKTITGVGTATVQLAINGVNLDGAANAAAVGGDTVAHSATNVVAVGAQLTVTFSGVSSDCENLTLQINGTTELA